MHGVTHVRGATSLLPRPGCWDEPAVDGGHESGAETGSSHREGRGAMPCPGLLASLVLQVSHAEMPGLFLLCLAPQQPQAPAHHHLHGDHLHGSMDTMPLPTWWAPSAGEIPAGFPWANRRPFPLTRRPLPVMGCWIGDVRWAAPQQSCCLAPAEVSVSMLGTRNGDGHGDTWTQTPHLPHWPQQAVHKSLVVASWAPDVSPKPPPWLSTSPRCPRLGSQHCKKW